MKRIYIVFGILTILTLLVILLLAWRLKSTEQITPFEDLAYTILSFIPLMWGIVLIQIYIDWNNDHDHMELFRDHISSRRSSDSFGSERPNNIELQPLTNPLNNDNV